jgi:hypothetical protein
MSSTMLEQAIIDAKSLKEAAVNRELAGTGRRSFDHWRGHFNRNRRCC